MGLEAVFGLIVIVLIHLVLGGVVFGIMGIFIKLYKSGRGGIVSVVASVIFGILGGIIFLSLVGMLGFGEHFRLIYSLFE